MKSGTIAGSGKLYDEVVTFFEYVPPMRLSRNLRKLLLTYLSVVQDGHSANMEDLLADIQYLFDLLDVATDELEK